MKYSFLPEAKKDLDLHAVYYKNLQESLGEDFLEEILSAISRITENPNAWTEIEDGIRRCLVKRFPYGVLYHFMEEQQEVLIIAIMHNHQKPDYWKDRF